MQKLYLASASPQRRALLQQLGWEPEICPVDTSEALPNDRQLLAGKPQLSCPSTTLPAQTELRYAVEYIAAGKLTAALAQYRQQIDQGVWLAADTLVAILNPRLAGNRKVAEPVPCKHELQAAGAKPWGPWLLLGKPTSPQAASCFLHYLSSSPQYVCSAIAWHDRSKPAWPQRYSEITRLQFHRLSPANIAAYIATEEWRGAAGGYRLQNQGRQLVAQITGSANTVIGLPVEWLRNSPQSPLYGISQMDKHDAHSCIRTRATF